MSSSITYDSKTREIVREENPRDKRYFIYVWGLEGDGYLKRVTFGKPYRVSTYCSRDPKKAKCMTESDALGLLARLDNVGVRANLVCFPSVTVLT